MIHVVVVSHGSRNAGWVSAQKIWFAGMSRHLATLSPLPLETTQTFLEISDPLFETHLERIAAEWAQGHRPFDRLAIFPFFLSRSFHSGEEIPGMAQRILTPAGIPWTLLEPAGWESCLGANAASRLLAYGARPGDPVVVCGYGSKLHDARWRALVAEVQSHSGPFAADAPWEWAPCGHFLPDNSLPLRQALHRLRESANTRAAILPLFLGVASYQTEMIPRVVAEYAHDGMRLLTRPDAVLPSDDIEQWAAATIARAAAMPVDNTP